MTILGTWTTPKLFVGEYELTPDSDNIKLSASRKMNPSSVFGSAWESIQPATLGVSLAAAGYANLTTLQQDDRLWADFSLANVPVTLMPTNGPVEGDTATFFEAMQAKYEVGGAYGDNLAWSLAAGKGNNAYPAVRGFVLEPGSASRAGGGNGAGFNTLGALTASQKLYAALHIVACTGTFNVKIQSAAAGTFVGANDRITFTQATTVGWQFPTPVNGAITDTYWRCLWTIAGGAVTFALVVGKV
jgi:hypothetical protein